MRAITLLVAIKEKCSNFKNLRFESINCQPVNMFAVYVYKTP